MLEGIELTRHICLLALAVVSVYTDVARGKLYNVVTLGSLALGLILALFLDAAAPANPGFLETRLFGALMAAALCSGLLLLPYLAGGLGAGDVKLMAAVGALGPGWIFALTALMFSALVGAAIAVAVLIWQGRLLQGLKGSARALFTLRHRPPEGAPAATIPYGLAIGIGTLWAWIETVLLAC